MCVAVISATLIVKYATVEKPCAVEAMSHAEKTIPPQSVTFADLASEVFAFVKECGI